ncbi:MAG: glycosyl transferase [Desulfuromonas sp.]|nr:MAG: glycosyl transferase [Desulfuromonas sp.]
MEKPILSIIVPVLNEAAEVQGFLDCLTMQEDIRFEVVFCDGGSIDGTLDMFDAAAGESRFPIRTIAGKPGRARQMNAGASVATGKFLLFLHIDSRFRDNYALNQGLQMLQRSVESSSRPVAGRFRLRFDTTDRDLAEQLYFWEWKARLNRPECIHGDQGFLLTKADFAALGPFDESLPLAEDSAFAEGFRRVGRWILLPAEILTSARRFALEGVRERQTLNALLMNFVAIGWDRFFEAATDIYRQQDRATRLRLPPYLELIQKLLAEHDWKSRLRLWYRTGVYVRPNAWQIAFQFDVYRARRQHLPPGVSTTPCLNFHDRWFDRITDNRVGNLVSALLTRAWFSLLARRERRVAQD